MGAWGPALFSDDDAMDVRYQYREFLEDGHSGPEATRLTVERYAPFLDDPDDGPVFWLALAATQWRLGRLEDDIRAKALAIIDGGVGLDLWAEQGPKMLEKRKAALQKVREQLLSPQPPPRKVSKPRPYYDPGFQVGNAFSYRLDSGKHVILRVVGHERDRYGTHTIIELCDWIGEAAPSADQIERLPAVVQENQYGGRSHRLAVAANKCSDCPEDMIRIVAPGLRVDKVELEQGQLPMEVGSCAWLYVSLWLESISPYLTDDPSPNRIRRAKPRVVRIRPREG